MAKFFGQYLLEKDILTKEQLLKAISYQRSKSEKLGDLAIKKRYLTKSEVAKISREQIRTDMMFGELAVRMQYLTQDQLRELLTLQESSHIFLGEAIVELGFLSKQQLAQALENFRKEESEDAPEIVLPDDLPYRLFLSTVSDMAIKLLRRSANILVKTSPIKTEQYYTLNLYLIALVNVSGEINGRCALKLNRHIATLLAQRFTHNDELTDEELIGDAIGEFLNTICGNAATKLTTSGTSMEINNPIILWNTKAELLQFEKMEFATVIPLFTSEGFAEILFITKTI